MSDHALEHGLRLHKIKSHLRKELCKSLVTEQKTVRNSCIYEYQWEHQVGGLKSSSKISAIGFRYYLMRVLAPRLVEACVL